MVSITHTQVASRFRTPLNCLWLPVAPPPKPDHWSVSTTNLRPLFFKPRRRATTRHWRRSWMQSRGCPYARTTALSSPRSRRWTGSVSGSESIPSHCLSSTINLWSFGHPNSHCMMAPHTCKQKEVIRFFWSVQPDSGSMGKMWRMLS